MENSRTDKPDRIRHRVVRALLNACMKPLVRIRFGFKPRPFPDAKKHAYFVLYNHETSFDQFFISLSFPIPVSFVATEDLFSHGFLSTLIRRYAAPIPFNKSAPDVRAIRNCMRVAKAGGTIALSPEGNRTYSGRLGTVKPAVAPLIRKLGLPVAFYRIDGGYGVQPRWANGNRKGKMSAGVSRVLEPAEYEKMSDDELYRTVITELSTDECIPAGKYTSPHRAEYMERLFYVCPRCGLSSFRSHKNEIFCLSCGAGAEYAEDKSLVPNSDAFPYRHIGEFYDAQEAFVRTLDLDALPTTALYTDRVKITRITPYKNRKLLDKKGELRLYRDRVEADIRGKTESYPFTEIKSAAVLGHNKLNLLCGQTLYQYKGSPRFNAVKYVNIYYHARAVRKGEPDDGFLGL